jgi:hypothetical protein
MTEKTVNLTFSDIKYLCKKYQIYVSYGISDVVFLSKSDRIYVNVNYLDHLHLTLRLPPRFDTLEEILIFLSFNDTMV